MLASSIATSQLFALKLYLILILTCSLPSNANDFSYEDPPIIKSPIFPFVLFDNSSAVSPQSFSILYCDADSF